jgi:RNA polymerase sigma-70 factor (ECF subfamily)
VNDSDDDERLVADIGRGSTEALAEAYQSHAGRVFSLARRALGDAALAGSVVEEVFLHLWDRPEEFDPRCGPLRGYLLRLARDRTAERRAVGGVRLQGREQAGGTDAGPGLLPEEEIQAIELAYFGGYSSRQVAELLDVPERMVTSRIGLGLKRLRLAMPTDPGGREPPR